MNYYETNNNRARTAQLKFEVQKLKKLLVIMSVMMVVCFAVCFFCIRNFTFVQLQLSQTEKELEFMSTNYDELTTEYNTLYTTYEGMYDEYVNTIDYTIDCQDQIVELYDQLVEMQEQNEALVESNNEYYETIQLYEQREELYDKYEYAIIRTDGTRTDITYDQLITVESLSEKEGVDTDLILSIVMVESNGDEDASNSTSTARGYGQILYGTGKMVYEDIMEAGTYSHDKAYNGTTNLTMMVELISYLTEVHDNDLYGVLQNYRGEGGSILSSYICKIDNYLENSNKSVATIASAMN